MHVCKECPRERWVTEFLYGLRTVADEEQIREFRFKKWITVDQSTLIDVVQTVDEFMSTLGEAAAQLTRHPCVTKVQSKFLEILCDSLTLAHARRFS